jgi:uncharacterized protein YciI
MKKIFLALLIFSVTASFAQRKYPPRHTKPKLDTMMIKRTGADEYGMKKYVVAFLKKGPNRNQDSATAAQLQKAHLDNITSLVNMGKLVVAGPFTDDGELRGIYVFNVATIEEAKKLTETDPAVQAGRLEMELHPWYASAALMEIPLLHTKIERKKH